MKEKNVKRIAITGIVAAVYAALTVGMAPISYGAIQMRLSEVMTLLAFVNPVFVPGLVLGNLIANLYSPFGLPDVIFGTMATFIAVLAMSKTKNLWVASLWPALVNGVIIGAELYFFAGLPLLVTMGYVALGEFIVVTLIGCPLYLAIKSRHKLSGLIHTK